MIKLENYEVVGWRHAIRGMRNPMNSWEKSDSGWNTSIPPLDVRCNDNLCWSDYSKKYITVIYGDEYNYDLGPNDIDLMMRLRNAGPVHRKFMRMIAVYVDITAPLYWWKEFDTYKVGTSANSCSTMHKIHAKEFTLDDFSHEHLVSGWSGKDNNSINIILSCPSECMENTITVLNRVRDSYLEAREKGSSPTGLSAKEIWWQMIQLLPSSYNQKRTVMLNYEVLANIYEWRKNHKLDEWVEFCKWIETLPYSELIIGAKPNEADNRIKEEQNDG